MGRVINIAVGEHPERLEELTRPPAAAVAPGDGSDEDSGMWWRD